MSECMVIGKGVKEKKAIIMNVLWKKWMIIKWMDDNKLLILDEWNGR